MTRMERLMVVTGLVLLVATVVLASNRAAIAAGPEASRATLGQTLEPAA